MDRRAFLTTISSLPLLGFLKPVAAQTPTQTSSEAFRLPSVLPRFPDGTTHAYWKADADIILGDIVTQPDARTLAVVSCSDARTQHIAGVAINHVRAGEHGWFLTSGPYPPASSRKWTP